jgi:hypothetical protein
LLDILTFLQDELKFNYSVIHTAYGSANPVDKRWSGLMGMLDRKTIDFSISGLTRTFDREQVPGWLQNFK